MQDHNGRRAAVFALLAAAWVGVLFFFSGQSGTESASLSSSLTNILFGGWIARGADAASLEKMLRKAAHFAVFAVEGFLLGTAFLSILRRRWAIVLTALISAALAFFNELDQCFSEGRNPSFADVVLDTAGALAGLAAAAVILHAFSRLRKKKDKGDSL